MSDFIIENDVLKKYVGTQAVVEIPQGIRTIGNGAFFEYHALTSVTLPDSVEIIGKDAFNFCKSLTSVTLPDSVKRIERGAFCGCKALASITLPASVKSIGAVAFRWCKSLTSVTLPESVEHIEREAFARCKALTSITLPASVKSIADEAFAGCTALTGIVLPDSLESIGVEAFARCKALTSITLPASVKSIADEAFAWCTALTSITIPASVESIGAEAFYRCTALTSVTVRSRSVDIHSTAFEHCPSLVYYYVFRQGKVEKEFAGTWSQELENLYRKARVEYTIRYHCSDYEYDDFENPWSGHYDNSYTVYREPTRKEMILKDGELYGFFADNRCVLPLDDPKAYEIRPLISWALIHEPCAARYVWIPWVDADCEEHRFSPQDFPKGLVKSVAKQVAKENRYGEFGRAFDVTVELTDEAAADPDATLAEFLNYEDGCMLVKKP